VADQRELQELQLYYNEYQQNLDYLRQQLNLVVERKMESRAAIDALETVREQVDETVLLPLGGGASLRARIPDPDTVLVNIGSDVVVTRTNPEAVEYLKGRITELESFEKKLAESIGSLQAQMEDIRRRLESVYFGQAPGSPAAGHNTE